MKSQSLHIGTRLMRLDSPVVMAILNSTPDSFVPSTRLANETEALHAAEKALREGATILDIGGYSTRPGAADISTEEEWQRVHKVAAVVRRAFPEAVLSVDTYRAEVARRAVSEDGVEIINDVSGGTLDETMFDTVATLHVPYILMHMRGTPKTMQTLTDYEDILSEMIAFFQTRIDHLSQLGVSDVVIDPGFGFSKTMEQNYYVLSHLHELTVLDKPILAGLSRKSMLYKALGTTQEEALNATTAANMVALLGGASILRVHDTRAAVEAVRIFNQLPLS